MFAFALIVALSNGPTAASGDGWNEPPFTILPETAAPPLMHQCSRPTPGPVVGFWSPTHRQILRLEALLPAHLATLGLRPAGSLGGYFRQYVGVVVGGRHLIYGSFIPQWLARRLNRGRRPGWRMAPFVICDGGREFWGIAFDVEFESFRDFAFNY
jgi:hypothetical protein